MAKLESSFMNMLLVLTSITIVASALLGGVYVLTQEPIAQAEAKKQLLAIEQVAPPFDNKPIDEMVKVSISAGDTLEVYPTRKGDELTGVVIKSNTNQGFSGYIYVMVGLDTKQLVKGFSVLSHAETPGLGSKMQEWFSNEANLRQSIIGRQLSDKALTVSKDGGDVDAITAATITSRAFLNAINRAQAAMKLYQATLNPADGAYDAEVLTGATAKK